MDLNQITTDLQNPDFQYRLKAISALRDYPTDTALPILLQHVRDPEFLVRSFVARELGYHLTDDSFTALLQIIKFDNTPNVRAEASNSLSLFGKLSAPHLVQTFFQDDHWLVQRSILAALVELECPEELFDVCVQALDGDDASVREAAILAFGTLTNSHRHRAALSHLLDLKNHPSDRIRVNVAYALQHFNDAEAKDALSQLQHDVDQHVINAAISMTQP